jgi:hypothetical protein
VNLQGKTVILADDGVATGATMKAAVKMLKREQVGMLIVAVPVATTGTAAELQRMVDVFVCPAIRGECMCVGSNFEDFMQVTGADVNRVLRDFRRVRQCDLSAEAPMGRVNSAGEELSRITNMKKEAYLYTVLRDNTDRCHTCQRECIIQEGKTGWC